MHLSAGRCDTFVVIAQYVDAGALKEAHHRADHPSLSAGSTV